MKVCVIISVILLFAGFSTSAQVDTLKFNSGKGQNSTITIKATRDSVVINARLSENNHSDTLRLPKIRGKALKFDDSVRGEFYRHLTSKLGLDSSNIDTLEKYIKKKSRDSIIVIKNEYEKQGKNIPVIRGDTARIGDDGPGSDESNSSKVDWVFWLLVGVIVLLLLAFLLIYLYKPASKKPIKKESSSEDILLDLKERLNIKTKSREPHSISKEIIDLYNDKDLQHENLKQELKKTKASLQSEISEIGEKLRTFEMQMKELDRQNKSKDQLIEKQRGIIDTLESQNKSVNEYGKKLLEIIYASLYKTLNDNRDIDPEKAKQLILKNTIICAFQSFSFFRINSGKYLEWDEMNRDIFFDKETRYLHLVTKNTPLNEVDPVAYYVMELLKDHGISVLDGVLVFGYKLGDHE